ncbi:RelA/SpoT family protein [Filifactor alocis ATCC 35896]|uniref:GTP diphosphokinase n=1 Tax=Filifactor alocis (strain ATCC 35896 / CCUG 47790 / D40 B5) TaxID=546269 RepID=D6GSB2_FILAD|nr:bifunctional (p)ppGpp synthetase/guanosine-3',5'-bis(diphosphate) 3'-pyrophosphohydrolase [Filifactor alocis]EFE28553.1 RelA/SpoT family protein [Filifactor alocis ATCC 35896]
MLSALLDKIREYNSGADVSIVEKAYLHAYEGHKNQYRKSGEKYIIHPVEVAKILAELEMDMDTIAAGLLHDVLEDTDMTYEEMASEFGTTIADLVDGVTKLGQIKYQSKQEMQAENFRKMFFAMGKDIRVVLIKLADRLHNMRTMKYMPKEKAIEKSKETAEIYAPIANRLGIFRIKWEMEDLALRYLDPDGYRELTEKVSLKRQEREKYIESVIEQIEVKLEENDITCDIKGRAKHFYSIYKKMKYQDKTFEEIYDLMAVRIIVDNIKDCYGAVGLVHTIWKPIPTRFKDYIAMPKPNMYQSLHTTVVGPDGEPLEIQIRTWDMNRIAEFGIAAHWKYKERFSANGNSDGEMEKKLSWIRQMMEWQKEVSDPEEFMESLKIDLFANKVFVFSPRGDVLELPAGSCPLDFAYKVHSQIGNKCVGAKVNSRMVPIDYKLKTGDIVEIITSGNSNGPSRDWLNIVKSSGAKTKIRQWFKKEKREENIEKGRELLEKETKKLGYPINDFLKQKYISAATKTLTNGNVEDLYAALGYGGITINQIMPKLKEKFEEDNKELLLEQKALKEKQEAEKRANIPRKQSKSSIGIHVEGIDNILIRLAKCCNPVPGDEIVGYITKGRGVSVHRKDCTNVSLNDGKNNDKRVVVYWDSNDLTSKEFEAEIQIIAYDRKSLFMDITRLFTEEKVSLNGINAKTNKENVAVMNFVIQVSSVDKLRSIMSKLRKIEGVSDVRRAVQ